jgi:hypothetical protein
VSTWFQGLFHPPLGVLFTFPSRYLFTIGRLKYLALESGLPSFPQNCTCFVVLRIQAQILHSSLRDSHPLRSRFPTRSSSMRLFVACPTTPVGTNTYWFGLIPVRSPLLRESRLISFRRATEMFQFTRCPPDGLCVQPSVSRHHSGWVAPFGISRFIACMQLPLNVSPVSASFFGFKRQGIHLVLCLACSQKCLLWVTRLLTQNVSRCLFGFLCVNSCCAARISKIEGISYSVGKVQIG